MAGDRDVTELLVEVSKIVARGVTLPVRVSFHRRKGWGRERPKGSTRGVVNLRPPEAARRTLAFVPRRLIVCANSFMPPPAAPEALPIETNFRAGDRPEHLAAQSPAPLRLQRRHPVRNTVIVLVVLALLGAGVYRIMQTRQAAAEKAAGPPKGGFAIPVVPGVATQKDVPIYLDGLGTIQALNTVTVRARVDGQIEKLAFNEGEEVKAGDLLAQIDPAPFQATLEQAQARQKQDEVQLANAREDLERYRDLVDKKVISRQQFDTQRATTAQLEAAVKNDQAAVQSAQVQLGYTKIVSPIDGRTGIRLVDAGNLVRASDANGIVVITQLRPIALLFTLPEQSLIDIHRQQQQGAAPLAVTAIAPNNKSVLGEGQLTVIDNQIDPTTGTIRLKAEFPNDKNDLWPGQFVNARLLLAKRTGGIVVPASVIQRGPDGAYAYVIQDGPDGPIVQMRPVQVAQVDAGAALIDSGLQAGERVVVDGQYKLQPGARVKLGDTPGHPGAQPGGHAGPRAVQPATPATPASGSQK